MDPFDSGSHSVILFQRANLVDPFQEPLRGREELFKHARDFELLIASFMARLGYAVLDLAGKGDCGADLIATKDNTRRCVQVKCSINPVRVTAVYQTTFAVRAYGADGAILVAMGGFTPRARIVARERCIHLVGGLNLRRAMNDDELLELRRIENEARAKASDIAAFGR